MSYNGLVNHFVIEELKPKIINGKIDRIFEPNFEEIVLGIYSNSSKYLLNIVINSQFYRINLTSNSKPNPIQAPNFCMTLRKYLLNTHITNIYTNNFERIVFIEFEGNNKIRDSLPKKLIIELMGKYSNIILVNSDNIIIDALKHFSINSGSLRNIFSGEKYVLPNSTKLDFMNIRNNEEFYNIIKSYSDFTKNNSLASIISNRFTGFDKESIKIYELKLNISDNINKTSAYLLFNYINRLIKNTENITCEEISNNYYLVSSINKNNTDLYINNFLDNFYTNKELQSIFTNYRNNLLKLILNKLDKLNSKLTSINDKLNECKNADTYKLYGELITSNLYKLNNSNLASITLENYYDNNNLINIPLDKSISPHVNAKNYFKKYRKLKNAITIINEQKDIVLSNINYLETIIYEIEIAKTIAEIDEIYSEIQNDNINLKYKKQKNFSNKKVKNNLKNKKDNQIGEILKFNIDGFTVLVGKNNKQNDYITLKLANNEDIWFHVKDFPGSHVVLRTENKIPSQDTINKCAYLAKKYSKVNQSSNINVDYTYIKYVKKQNKAKLGMVIYTNNKTVIVH